MIKWCSYCLRYLGEIEPLEDYAVSHGICRECLRTVRDGVDRDRIDELREFNQRLQSLSYRARSEIDGLIRDGAALGMRPLDLMVGMLQPLLYDIGEKWARGEATVADEHRLTAAAAVTLDRMFERYVDPSKRQSEHPLVLLVCAQGNTHELGARMVEFMLLQAELPTFAVYPGMPNRQVMDLAAGLEPSYLGVSVALAEQLPAVAELAEAVHAGAGNHPKIVLGGCGVRTARVTTSLPGMMIMESAQSFLDLVQAAPLPAGDHQRFGVKPE